MAYVTSPTLVEQVLLEGNARSSASRPIEKRVFRNTLGDGILASQGAEAGAGNGAPRRRWPRRHLNALVPMMTAEAEAQAKRWAAAPGRAHAIDADMTETTFRVISSTMFGGKADADTREILAASDEALSPCRGTSRRR